MKTQEQHDYLIGLIKELEKLEDKQALNNFIIVVEDLLKVKYRLRNYFDYPISAADYDELTTYAENLLGIPSSTGRTTPTTGGPGASNDVDSFNTMTDIEVEALVDYALVDMKLVEYILNNYTPNQLTIDWVQQAAAGHVVGGVKVYVIDGMKVNKQTADYIEMKIKQIQEYEWVPNAETIAAIEEAANADPKDLHSWEDVKKEFFGDNTDTNRYANMTEEEYVKLYYHEAPKAFTKRWNERVAGFIGDIKEIESNLEERNNEFDGEIIQDLERRLLNFLKKTL